MEFREAPLPPYRQNIAFELDVSTSKNPLLKEYQKIVKDQKRKQMLLKSA
jgi:hypothetical protein